MASPKILVLGDVNGQLAQCFTKVTSLHAKQSFAFAIITGNLFSSEDDDVVLNLLAGKISIPLPTYFTVATVPLPRSIAERVEKDEEICPNLHFLGKRSTTKTSEGVKVVTLGGKLDESVLGGISKENHLPSHTIGDAKALYGANSADILLTSIWPSSIMNGSKVALPEGVMAPAGSQHIADLCASLKPKYHLSASDFFFEREPFFSNGTVHSPESKPITRFLSIAPFGNQSKQKFLYAFVLHLSPDPAASLPKDATPTPFLRPKNNKRMRDPDTYSRYATNGCDSWRPKRGRRQPPPRQDQCFFCLSNSDLPTHLVTSIGDDAYLTMAKGPLSTPTMYQELGINNTAHVLIIPLTHSPTLAFIDDPKDEKGETVKTGSEKSSKEKTFTEMKRYKDALQTMISIKSNNKLGSVTYEISKADGVHTHWQFVPMPAEIIDKGLVEAGFRVEAENNQYPPFEDRDPGIGENESDFFRAWIWTPPSKDHPAGATKCLTMPFDYKLRFSLQFGRTVLAKLLGLESRLQWRDCDLGLEGETKDADAFKEMFIEFDPSP